MCNCQEGWVCENHPDKGWPDGCDCGAGKKCEQPNCPWWKGPSPAALNTDDWQTDDHEPKVQ